jgi:hypothetical protein
MAKIEATEDIALEKSANNSKTVQSILIWIGVRIAHIVVILSPVQCGLNKACVTEDGEAINNENERTFRFYILRLSH